VKSTEFIEVYYKEGKNYTYKGHNGKLIRCRDCRYFTSAECKADGTPDLRFKPSVCNKDMYAVYRKENWYCADAEEKQYADNVFGL